MVLVNILYFKGTWKHKFKKYRTTDREFYIGTNRHVLVPTMQLEQQLRYAGNKILFLNCRNFAYFGLQVPKFILLIYSKFILQNYP